MYSRGKGLNLFHLGHRGSAAASRRPSPCDFCAGSTRRPGQTCIQQRSPCSSGPGCSLPSDLVGRVTGGSSGSRRPQFSWCPVSSTCPLAQMSSGPRTLKLCKRWSCGTASRGGLAGGHWPLLESLFWEAANAVVAVATVAPLALFGIVGGCSLMSCTAACVPNLTLETRVHGFGGYQEGPQCLHALGYVVPGGFAQ